MNQEMAETIRSLREQRCWTQEHLAAAAGVTVRTIQRAEDGRGVSAETMQAIAGAFDVSVDVLRGAPLRELGKLLGIPPDNVTPELVQQKLAEMAARFEVVPLVVVENGAHLAPVLGAGALHFDCKAAAEPIRRRAAELRQYIFDVINLGDDASPTDGHDFETEILAMVSDLRSAGATVSVALHRQTRRFGNGDLERWPVAYVIVASADETPPAVLIEREGGAH